MSQYLVSPQNASALAALPQLVAQKAKQVVALAVMRATYRIQMIWMEAANDAKYVWPELRNEYIKSIQADGVPGKLEGTIWSDHKWAERIETGMPQRDLKEMLNTSSKVRISKQGKKYLIIPFRHNTPGNSAYAADMPTVIYDQAKGLKASYVTGAFWQKSLQTGSKIGSGIGRGKATMVKRLTYRWGESLPAGLAPKMKPHHTTDIYAGMKRFDTSSGKQKSSAYLTFRNMVEGSPKWLTTPKPGQFIAEGAAKKGEEILRQEIESGLIDLFPK